MEHGNKFNSLIKKKVIMSNSATSFNRKFVHLNKQYYLKIFIIFQILQISDFNEVLIYEPKIITKRLVEIYYFSFTTIVL